MLLNLLERLGRLPAEVWLLPPVAILTAMAATSLILRSARLRRFRAIADRTGLGVRARIMNPSEVTGTFRGRPLAMTTASPQGPTLRRRWTLVTVGLKNPQLVRLRMRRQDFFDNLIVSAGFKDVQIGDAAFDRRFIIHSGEPALVAKVFEDRDLRDLVVRAGLDSVDLGSERMRVYYAREERDPEHAELLFTAATRLADGLDALAADGTPEIIRVDAARAGPS